jgi:RNA polymerase sigma-70 factor (ECF subfamily)
VVGRRFDRGPRTGWASRPYSFPKHGTGNVAVQLSWVTERMDLQIEQSATGRTHRPALDQAPAMTEDEIDCRVIVRIANGDVEALGQLFDRHASIMLGVAYRVLRNRDDAEDLVHDVFIEVSRKASTYDQSRSKVRTWLLMRVRSRAIDRLRTLEVARRANRAEPREREIISLRSGTTTQEISADGRRARAAMARLTPHQFQVIELAYFGGRTLSEISADQQIPIGTVKSRLAAALAALRSLLSDEAQPVALVREGKPL